MADCGIQAGHQSLPSALNILIRHTSRIPISYTEEQCGITVRNSRNKVSLLSPAPYISIRYVLTSKMQIGEKFSPNLNQPLIQKNGKPVCSDFQGYAASSCAFFRQVWVLLTQPSSFSRDDRLEVYKSKFRLPKAVQAAYMKPLKRKPEYGLPVCNLQLRSYSARHVEFFADFALRAAYYLNIPASGPVPLPRIVERWTVIRSPFVHKKSKENFERITCRRLIQLQDGHPESVQAWLAFLRKHAFHGVGMKANVFEHTSLGMSFILIFLGFGLMLILCYRCWKGDGRGGCKSREDS